MAVKLAEAVGRKPRASLHDDDVLAALDVYNQAKEDAK